MATDEKAELIAALERKTLDGRLGWTAAGGSVGARVQGLAFEFETRTYRFSRWVRFTAMSGKIELLRVEPGGEYSGLVSSLYSALPAHDAAVVRDRARDLAAALAAVEAL